MMEFLNKRAAAVALQHGPKRFEAKQKDGVCELFLYDAIGADPWTGGGITATDVAEKLREFKGAKTMTLYINSPGGSITDGVAIYNELNLFDGQITARIMGIAASAASFIAMAADKIVTEQGATWMIHRAMGGAWGFDEDLRATADVLTMFTETIADLYAKRTKGDRAKIMEMMKAETFMTAQEAKALGFTDEITEDKVEATNAAPPAPVATLRKPMSMEAARRVLKIARSTDQRLAAVEARACSGTTTTK